MATFFAFLALALLVGACYFIYSRSMATAEPMDDSDLQRYMVANRELHLQRIDPEVWENAMRTAHGDEGVARARYIQFRVQQMKRESAAAEVAQEP